MRRRVVAIVLVALPVCVAACGSSATVSIAYRDGYVSGYQGGMCDVAGYILATSFQSQPDDQAQWTQGCNAGANEFTYESNHPGAIPKPTP